MSIDVITEFVAKRTVRTIVYVYNDSDALVDPTSVTVTIKDPAGTTVVNAVAMTKTATGTYEHYYNTTTNSTKGEYPSSVDVTDGVGAGAKNSGCEYSFKVK